MQSLLEWEHNETPPARGPYTVMLDEDGRLFIKTAHWSPSSGLWFCDCKTVKPMAWAKSVKHS